ncbi:MAG: AsmA family protein [Elusimicrobia bacterium]|nr:AsmA family protein [Elusimicrobiota bacterium]
MKNALRMAGALVAVLLLVAIGALSLFLGRIVKAGVEAAGPRVLGVPVTLASATIVPWSGRGTLRGLVIGNPPGFRGPQAVRVGEISVTLEPSSLFSDTIVVESVAVRAPEIDLELGPGGSNLARLQKNAEAAAGGSAPAKAAPAAPAKKGKSLLIRDLAVTGGKVGLSAAALGGKDMSVALPDLRLTNLGGPGRSPAEAASQALREIASSAQRAGQAALQRAGAQALDRAAKDLAPKLQGFLKGLRR